MAFRVLSIQQNPGTGENDWEIFLKGFQEIQKLLTSEIRTLQSKIQEIPTGNQMEQKFPVTNCYIPEMFELEMFELETKLVNWKASPAHSLLGSHSLLCDDPHKGLEEDKC